MDAELQTNQPLAVVYDPPGMGLARVPNPIQGEGTLALRPDGLSVVGKKSRDVSALAFLAFLGSLGIGIYFDLGARVSAAIALACIARRLQHPLGREEADRGALSLALDSQGPVR
jgi:hypothetical protein